MSKKSMDFSSTKLTFIHYLAPFASKKGIEIRSLQDFLRSPSVLVEFTPKPKPAGKYVGKPKVQAQLPRYWAQKILIFALINSCRAGQSPKPMWRDASLPLHTYAAGKKVSSLRN